MAKEEKHSHDYNGRRETQRPIQIGRDLVTYEKVFCTCGKLMENNIIDRQSNN